jgi:mRNA interferase RelE/StbE
LPEYRVLETEQFQRDLQEITKSGQPAVVAKLRAVVYPQLVAHPHFGPSIRKLKGYAPPTWRYRIGVWRFFYEIDETRRVVSMVAAFHRGSAY